MSQEKHWKNSYETLANPEVGKRTPPFFTELHDGSIFFVTFVDVPRKIVIGFPKLTKVAGSASEHHGFNKQTTYSDSAAVAKHHVGAFSARFYPPFGTEVPAADFSSVKRIFSPRNWDVHVTPGEQDVYDLVGALESQLHIPRRYIGVEGSFVTSTNQSSSDIDLFVYGARFGRHLRDKFHTGTNIGVDFTAYPVDQNKSTDSIRFGVANTRMHELQNQRRFYGIFRGRKFSIIVVPIPKTPGSIDLTRKLVREGMYKGDATVIDDTYATLTPSYAQLKCSDGQVRRLEIFSHYGTNQLQRGDRVHVEAPEYSVAGSSKKILILSHWSEQSGVCDILHPHARR